jgi:hypothetical protein
MPATKGARTTWKAGTKEYDTPEAAMTFLRDCKEKGPKPAVTTLQGPETN